MAKPNIVFVYARAGGFSGQAFATELLYEGLGGRGWECALAKTPVFSRGGGIKSAAPYLRQLAEAWLKVYRAARDSQTIIHLNLGQTLAAAVREGLPFVMGRALKGDERAVVSLHGSVFMTWSRRSLMAVVFRLVMEKASVVTVLGENQRKKLEALGIPAAKIHVVPNSCGLEAIGGPEVVRKQEEAGVVRPLTLLFLSNLIEGKGYVEFVEAVGLLAKKPDLRVKAVLCGKLCLTGHSDARFRSLEEAGEWLTKKLQEINSSKSVTLEWVQGAWGTQKVDLFRAADIFILPSRYAVEAQPIVLVEAMASGCCLVSSTVGEIPSTVGGAGVLLEKPTAQETAGAIEALVLNDRRRCELAMLAQERFVQTFALERHLDQWEGILEGLLPLSSTATTPPLEAASRTGTQGKR